MAKELIVENINRDLMPECLRQDQYYVLNDQFVAKELEIKNEINRLNEIVAPWEANFAKLYAEGKSILALSKELEKKREMLSKIAEKPIIIELVHLWQHLNVYQAGPNQLIRKQMLWRIAVDNEKTDPKECVKAIAELNRMEEAKKNAPTGKIEIVISNSGALPRGGLDD